MGLIRELGRRAWRKWAVDGVSASGPNRPSTEDIFPFVDAVDALFANIAALIGTAIQWKTAVRVAATTNINIATTSNGAVVSGVTLATGNRIALMAQSAGAENGIYVVQASGPLLRASDADTEAEVRGMAFYVAEGAEAGKSYLCSTLGAITVGSTALSFVLIADTSSLNATLAAAQAAITLLTTRADQKILPIFPLVVDGAKLLIPGYFLWNKGTSTSFAPPDGSRYWEFSLPTDGVRWWYADLTSPNSPVQVDGGASPQTDGSSRVLLAYCINGQVTSDFPIITSGSGDRGENQWDAGRYPDAASSLSQTTTVVVDANAALQALGFARAVSDPTALNLYYGGDIPEVTVGADYGFGRIWIYSSVANDFGSEARVNFLKAGEFAGQRNFSLEKKISANLAVYSGAFDVTVAGADSFNIGITQNAAGRNQIVAQLAFSRKPINWLSRNDFPPDPAQIKPAIGRHLWMISGRPLPIYLENLVGQMGDDRPVSGGFWSVKTADAAYPHMPSGERQILIDPEQCGATGYLELRRKGMRGRRDLRDIVEMIIHRADPVTKTVKVLLIGDSLTNRRLAAKIALKLAALGITVQWIGTLAGSNTDNLAGDAYITDASGPLGEGRDGWKIAEFINMVPTYGAAYDDWTAYNAGNKAYRKERNPFLKVPSGEATSGANQLVYNGKVFSLANYLAQTSQATPDVIIIGLGTNDMFQADYLSYMSNGLRVMLAQCRAAAPNARIGWWFPINPMSYSGLSLRPKAQAIIRQSVAQIIALNDPKTFEIPVWASLDPNMGWRMNIGTADATGVKSIDINDSVHLGLDPAPNRERVAEIHAAFIAA